MSSERGLLIFELSARSGFPWRRNHHYWHRRSRVRAYRPHYQPHRWHDAGGVRWSGRGLWAKSHRCGRHHPTASHRRL